MTRRSLLALAGYSAFTAAEGRGEVREAMPSNNEKLMLWYDKPAQSAMNEALPIGNGRLGGVVFGGTASERFAFNEDSLWTGDANPTGNYDTMGAYQAFGDLLIDLPGHDAATDYRRDLDIADALAHVVYRVGGVPYRREYLASHPAQVVAIRLTSDRPDAYTGTIRLRDAHGAKIAIARNVLSAAGALANGLRYESQVCLLASGGTVTPNAAGDGFDFRGCDALTFLLAAGTDYAMDAARGFRTGVAPHAPIADRLAAASKQPYDALREAHIREYRTFFDRAALDLGRSPADRRALPTDRRKVLAAQGGDPELEALLFQYGRYLLISSSRPGSLPANLQGLWNDSNDPPWHSDYHANINIQMNYWLAEPTGLGDCHLPLFDLIESQLPDWRKATAAEPEFALPDGKPVRGWALRTSHNTMGGMGWNWDKTANAWYTRHFYEHWVYTRDTDFLRHAAYPILKETCAFWQDHLKTLPDGRYVVPNAWSPEHGPVEDGVSYSQEIVWDLFTNYLDAGQALGVDAGYRKQIAALRDKLVVPAIGRWGQLQEWMTDRDDPEDHHRHTSHLFAVYPGQQIDPKGTPALSAAAGKSLLARGDGGDTREWSFAWRTALWARLGDGDRAHGQFLQLLSDRNSCPNLLGQHPPMQMDGNFGVTAGVAEMLLQSRDNGDITLLPALPAVWQNGSFRGLRARGGVMVDAAWSKGKLVDATLRRASGEGGTVRIRYGEREVEVNLRAKATVRLGGDLG